MMILKFLDMMIGRRRSMRWKVEGVPCTKEEYKSLVSAKFVNHYEIALIKYDDKYQELLFKVETIGK